MKPFPKRLLVIFTLVLVFWTSVLDANQQKGRKYDLLSVNFPASSAEGWACGRWGTILKTNDYGESWSKQQSNTDYTLASIFFIDAQTGWAVGNGGTILHTRDGGRNWVTQKSPINYYLMSVCFTDPKNGWIVSERTTILNTQDSGNTWNVQFKEDDYILKSVAFCDTMNGWAVGEYGFIYSTKNGGKSWEKQAGQFEVNEYGDFKGERTLFDVVAVDPTTAWVVGIDGYVARTIDGGRTWKQVNGNFPKVHLFGICSDAGKKFFIVGKGVFVSSMDGGLTFREVSMNPTVKYGWLYSVRSMGDNGFVAVGSDGWIYRSKKRGLAWEKVE